MAHKLAVLVYRMLRWGQEYVDKGMQYYEDRHREQQIHFLKKRAAKLGLVVV
jgi:transposase